MSVSFLPSIDIVKYATETRGLSLKALSYFTNVHALLTPDNIEYAPAYLRETIGLYETHFDVSALESLDDILHLLDSGARKVFVTLKQLESLRQAGVEKARLVKTVDAKCAASAQNSCAVASHAVHLRNACNIDDLVAAIDKSNEDPLENEHGPVFVTLKSADEDAAFRLAQCGAIPIVPATHLTLDKKAYPKLISAPDLLMARAMSDRDDGLFSTIVTDERGTALGLVYSSKESVIESLRSGRGVYQSRKRGLWRKGETSGDVQELISLRFDCDYDTLCFMVKQKGKGFCHRETATCFGEYMGLSKLQQTLKGRKKSAPEGSYTARLFNDPELLNAKIKEEAAELCEANTREDISWEAADLIFFALTKCIAAGVSLDDVELNLDVKSVKVKRRAGDAKPPFLHHEHPDTGAKFADGVSNVETTRANVALQSRAEAAKSSNGQPNGGGPRVKHPANGAKIQTNKNVPLIQVEPASAIDRKIEMKRFVTADYPPGEIWEALKRPSQRSNEKTMGAVMPIIKDVRDRGDSALLDYTKSFDKATLQSPVIESPFAPELMKIAPETAEAIDLAFDNIQRFHAAQKETGPLSIETMPGVQCTRFARPIGRVGLYVPGGTAVLPSSAMMLGVPAMVAGCEKIILATPPRPDGTVTPEMVYIADKIGAKSIVLAGGAQAVAALAYGTESVTKVDKILGPGNQYVTAAKMYVSNDTQAGVSIDMPAGPSEVLVVADKTANPAFVAADLLSQAEHGIDSQVILLAVDLSEAQVTAIEDQIHTQASALPRVDIIRGAIKNSVTLCVSTVAEAMTYANAYAPEHLILQVEDSEHAATLVENAGSVFIGHWTPESVGDYSAGVNHSLPTYGYARQYSGVNLGSYVKHITSSRCTKDGLKGLAGSVMELARVEELDAHRRAVSIRLDAMDTKA